MEIVISTQAEFDQAFGSADTITVDPCPACASASGITLTHVFPAAGTRVRVIDAVETREPGDDGCTPIQVRAGEDGVVVGYVVEWHDVHVALATQDGQDVWIDVDNLEVIR